MANKQVFPTKGNLIATKKSNDLAHMGYELMDRKRNILTREMMSLLDDVKLLREDVYKRQRVWKSEKSIERKQKTA